MAGRLEFYAQLPYAWVVGTTLDRHGHILISGLYFL
jgi:hypothetical protein